MKLNLDDMINSILNNISEIDYIKPEDIPNIDLYMDQVTTFIDSQLDKSRRYPDDKILTKTMINNYAKNHLLPSPNKKKYSKEHVLMLIFIYYFKSFLSISDIQSLLTPLSDKYFQNTEGINIEQLYREVLSLEKEQTEKLKSDIIDRYKVSEQAFLDAPAEDQEFLRLFSFISLLSIDVYVKKHLIESILDSFLDD